MVFILALGNLVARIFSAVAVLTLFFAASFFGAVVYGLILPEAAPLIGAYPGVYGLIGAYTFLMWVDLAARGGEQYRAFSLIAILLAIQLLFSLIFDTGNDWVADIGGFVAGFLLSFVLSPGGWQRFLNKLRQR